MDNNQSEKTYPRPGIDPYAGRSIPIKSVTSNAITIYAGISRENVYLLLLQQHMILQPKI